MKDFLWPFLASFQIVRLRNRLTRRLMDVLPRLLRQALVRRRLKLDWNQDDSLVVRKAYTPEERQSAYRLVYRAYREIGATSSCPKEQRQTPYHDQPSTIVAIALKDAKTVGTLSYIIDETGLPADAALDLGPFRAFGERLCEYSSLAVSPEYRKNGYTLFRLFREVIELTYRSSSIDRAIIVVAPIYQDLYEGLLGFECLTPVFSYDFANGHPSIALTVRLDEWPERMRKLYGDRWTRHNLYLFLGFDQIRNKLIEEKLGIEPSHVKAKDCPG